MSITPAQAIAATKAAARAWMMYNSRLRLIYMGTTSDLPVPGDGKFVIGWMLGTPAAGMAMSKGGESEADIWINANRIWRHIPCHTRCTAVRSEHCFQCTRHGPDQLHEWTGGGAISKGLVQGVLTHEFGHALGLDHVYDPGLTMVDQQWGKYENPPQGFVSRELSTLGLGDVLGVKELYPWKCPKRKKGQPYPSAYKYVCPTIRIFVP